MQLLAIFASIAIFSQSSKANPVNGYENNVNQEKEPKCFIHEDLDITQPNEPKAVSRMNVDRHSFRRWPNAVVPYIISNDYQQWEKDVVTKAMRNIEAVSCVRFRQRSNEKDYILITPDYANGYNCYSYVGRQGGQQLVKMQKDCVRNSAMTHELIHAIGFGHENQRPDARRYIEILKDNIDPKYYQSAYEPYSSYYYTTQNRPYDFYSIMHYPDYAYVKRAGLKSMRSINPPNVDLSQERTKISHGDVQMIKLYYNCR